MRGMRWLAATTALVLFLGLHWAVLQTVAWTRMVIEFSQSMPLARAISWTFDGRHPCPLCLAIKGGRQSEQTESPSASKLPVKLECDLPAEPLALFETVAEAIQLPACAAAESRTDDPPKPRPRRNGIA